jgi:hypothetical protein
MFFSLNSPQNAASENRSSSVPGFFRNILPVYFSSTWSCAQFTVPEQKFICGFGAPEPKSDNTKSNAHSINVLCSNGKYYKYLFDSEKKEAQCVQSGNFHELDD